MFHNNLYVTSCFEAQYSYGNISKQLLLCIRSCMHAVGTHYIHRVYAVCKHLLHCILCAQSMHNSAVCSADKVPLTTAPHTV